MIRQERNVKIGGVRNLDKLQERVLITDLQPLSVQEARAAEYQTKWTALVPHLPPRPATKEDLLPFITEKADSREHLIFFKVSQTGLAKIEEVRKKRQLWDTFPKYEGPVIELVPGVEAHLSKIVPSLENRATSARMRVANNPDFTNDTQFKDLDSVGVHFDYEGDHPVETRLEDSRRIVVNLGPAPRYSVVVVPDGVLDIAHAVHPDDTGYVPEFDTLIPELIRRRGLNKILMTRLDPGEGYVLPSHSLWHDGSTYGQEKSDSVVLFEPRDGNRWNSEALLRHSIFNTQ